MTLGELGRIIQIEIERALRQGRDPERIEVNLTAMIDSLDITTTEHQAMERHAQNVTVQLRGELRYYKELAEGGMRTAA